MTSNNTVYVPVWAPNIDGQLRSVWYTSSLCEPTSVVKSISYTAFTKFGSTTAHSCQQATATLERELGPIYKTPWGCVYSEKSSGWYRPECRVKTIPEQILQDDFWSTPGGVFLAIFIAFVCVFFLWWISLCYRTRKCIGVCAGMQEIDFDHRLLSRWRYGGRRRSKMGATDDDVLVYENGLNNPAYESDDSQDGSEASA